jgi:hypothetical protein
VPAYVAATFLLQRWRSTLLRSRYTRGRRPGSKLVVRLRNLWMRNCSKKPER